MKMFVTVSVLALSLISCSGEPGSPEQTSDTSLVSVEPPEASSADEPPVGEVKRDANVLALEGLGELRVGEPIPAGSQWAERGAQASDICRTITSPDYRGAYAIVEDGAVRRITVGQGSEVQLAEGIGVRASEADVLKWFAGFRETPHEYAEAPAKYLTAPNADSGGPALRFEIDTGGKVSLIHVGTMPVLGYVEGCA